VLFRSGEKRSRVAYLILLVEDNPADVDLIQESLAEGTIRVKVDVAMNGEEAVDYLAGKGGPATPQLILLDLNLPRLDGRQVLTEIKASGDLRHIPVVVLSSSTAEKDILESYKLGASCYLAKPLDFESYRDMVRAIENFWLTKAKLPPRADVGPQER
jgi:chemotaxis family two-component system response regulator Rcp1